MDTTPERQPQIREYLESGAAVPFDLPTPCRALVHGLQCGLTEGYITVKPFNSSYHYERRCNNGHFSDYVKHAEVLLHFGVPETSGEKRATVIDALTPARRVAFNVRVRDRFTCVYCGRRAGEVGLDGSAIAIDAGHIIAKALIDANAIRLDRELLQFAKDIQLVSACHSCNSAKQRELALLETARDVFVRHVLKGETRGANFGKVALLERLHRLADHNPRQASRGTSTRPAPVVDVGHRTQLLPR